MRLIDADALLKKCIEGDGDNQFTEGYNFAVQGISAYITLAPTIEAEPVRHGRWIELPKALNPEETPCKCSACGHILSFYGYYPKSNFCPKCGALMDGGADNG